MTDLPRRVSDSWSEGLRMRRFRLRREKLHFWQEFKLIPRWIVWTVVGLFLCAQAIALMVNLNPQLNEGVVFPPELVGHPVVQSLALAGIITAVSLFLASFILLTAYVNRDAKRRGMSSGLWTFLVVVLSPAYFAIGFIIYFLMRQPLPYECPRCGTQVSARFNFCPNCRCNLHPSCPQCKQEVIESDKYCPNCAQDLRRGAAPETAAVVPSSS
jgi:hypothetical protein